MAKHELEEVELTNMCMIENKDNQKVLVQVRNKKDWGGLSFPGGHVEKGESIVQSVIREVEEETGLIVSNLIPCGLKDWYDYKKQKRYIVFFYKTKNYTGSLIDTCSEGENRWMSIEDIYKHDLALDFQEMLDIFTGQKGYTEFFYEDGQTDDEKQRWRKRFY